MSVFTESTPDQRRTLTAAALGWALDAFDVMLFSLVVSHLMRDLGLSPASAGFLNTLTLLASGVGGLLFGWIADRIGRKRALIFSILTYSICSLGSGLANSMAVLATFRFILGLGMGGEWNTGATLVAETWPMHLRARAMALVQSSWALGFAAAALVTFAVLQVANWRVVFFVGVLPALVTLWIRRDVPESSMWQQRRNDGDTERATTGSFWEIFSKDYLRSTIALLCLNLFGMFAWWGLFTWVPSYLSLPIAQGGRGFGEAQKTMLLVALNLTGMFPGYASFGWVADKIGRRRSFVVYTLAASLLVPLYALAHNPWMLLLLGTPVAFFGTGFFSGSGIIGSEIFPTAVRARALGFTYNGARALSSVGPWVIGWLSKEHGLSAAFMVCAASFFLAAMAATQLPETKGKELV
jgi:MFS family permease